MITKARRINSLIPDIDALRSSASRRTPAWLTKIRETALNRFNLVGFPTLKDEEWKYTNVSSIAEKQFRLPMQHDIIEKAELDEYRKDSQITLVFVNGVFAVKYSDIKNLPKGLSITNLADKSAKTETVVQDVLKRYEPAKEDAFASLNR